MLIKRLNLMERLGFVFSDFFLSILLSEFIFGSLAVAMAYYPPEEQGWSMAFEDDDAGEALVGGGRKPVRFLLTRIPYLSGCGAGLTDR